MTPPTILLPVCIILFSFLGVIFAAYFIKRFIRIKNKVAEAPGQEFSLKNKNEKGFSNVKPPYPFMAKAK